MLSSNSFSGSNTFNVGGSILDFSNFNIVQRFSDGNNGFVSIFVSSAQVLEPQPHSHDQFRLTNTPI